MILAEFRRKPVYPVVYMFVVMFCFTAVLVALARSASERIEANKRILFEKALLEAVGAEFDASSPVTIHAAFVASIKEPTPESFGAYISTNAYALPFEGQGFWNTIKGVIGIKPDGRTITGIAFYEQSETPGLGAEITKPRFRDSFKGIVLSDGPAPLTLKQSGDAETPGVDAIAGATQTCTRLEKILNDALKEWQKR